jgi:hypothetical protein
MWDLWSTSVTGTKSTPSAFFLPPLYTIIPSMFHAPIHSYYTEAKYKNKGINAKRKRAHKKKDRERR